MSNKDLVSLMLFAAAGFAAVSLSSRARASRDIGPVGSPSPSPTPSLPSLTPIDLSDAGAFQVIDVPGLSGRNIAIEGWGGQATDWLKANYNLPGGRAEVSLYQGFIAPEGAAQITFEGQPFRLLLV